MTITSTVPNIFSNGVVMSSADMIENYNHIIDDVNNNATPIQNPIIQAMPFGEFIPEELADANKVMANFEHIRSQINERSTGIDTIDAFPHNIQNEQVNDATQVNENFEHLVVSINGVTPGIGGDLVVFGIDSLPGSPPYDQTPYISTDTGLTWVAQTDVSTTADDVIAGVHGNEYVATIEDSVTQQSVASADGSSWSLGSIPQPGDDWSTIAWSGTIYIASSPQNRNIIISSDGINWTEHVDAVPASFGGFGFGCMAWNGTVFAAGSESNLGKIATSTDGINWVEQTAPGGSASFDTMVWNGTIFHVSGSSQRAMTSPDGITWTRYDVPFLGGVPSIAWGNGRFVFVASNSQNAYYSTDGINWIFQSSVLTFPEALDELVFNGDQFVGVDTVDGITYRSPDGVAWNRNANLPTAFGVRYRALMTTNKEFVTF